MSTSAAPSPEHLAQLKQAHQAGAKLRWAVYFAYSDGLAIAFFALISVPFSIASISTLLLCVGMALVAWREFRAAARLKLLDETALPELAWNELIFSAMIIVYCLWYIWGALHEQTADVSMIASAAKELGISTSDLEQYARIVSVIFWLAMILGSLLYQGGAAWYYFSRRKALRQYIERTPAWIVDFQRDGGTV
jgi:hypothetical protein